MENEIIALELEIRHRNSQKQTFCFNDTMLHALISGLSVVYSEVFIWSAGHHLAVWAIGGGPHVLVHTFMHHRSHYKKMQLSAGAKALKLFGGIVDGTIWKDCSMVSKLETFQNAFELSIELECLRTNLTPQINQGFLILNAAPEISGARNSWSYKKEERFPVVVQPGSPNLFYRFCIN